MINDKKELEKWIDQESEELQERVNEIDRLMPMLQEQLNRLGIEKISVQGGLVELKKIRKEFLGLKDEEEDENKNKEDES